MKPRPLFAPLLALALLVFAPAATRAEDEPTEAEGSQPTVSLEATDQPVRDLLRQLAELGELNLILADDVDGEVSFGVKDAPIRLALELVAKQAGLEVVEEAGGILRVKKAGATDADQRIFDVRDLDGVQLTALVRLLRDLGIPSPRMRMQDETHLVFRGTAEQRDRLDAALRKLREEEDETGRLRLGAHTLAIGAEIGEDGVLRYRVVPRHDVPKVRLWKASDDARIQSFFRVQDLDPAQREILERTVASLEKMAPTFTARFQGDNEQELVVVGPRPYVDAVASVLNQLRKNEPGDYMVVQVPPSPAGLVEGQAAREAAVRAAADAKVRLHEARRAAVEALRKLAEAEATPAEPSPQEKLDALRDEIHALRDEIREIKEILLERQASER